MKRVLAIAIAVMPVSVFADYLGILKAPASSLDSTGLYSFANVPASSLTLAPENGYRLKLGYKYSRYLAVESELTDFSRPADAFSNPANLASAFRSTGFGVDTVATLPLWRFSFYGRMGAYRGERNNSFYTPASALLPEAAARGTRWRYGLGVRYDFTKSLGVRAEVERYANPGLGSPFAGDGEADQVTVGLSWRF